MICKAWRKAWHTCVDLCLDLLFGKPDGDDDYIMFEPKPKPDA